MDEPDSQDRMIALLEACAAAHGRTQLDQRAIDWYLEVCGEMPLERFKRALKIAEERARFMPSPGEIVRAANDLPAAREPWEDQETYRCSQCRDRGFTVEDREEGPFSVPCGCSGGDRWNDGLRVWKDRMESEGRTGPRKRLRSAGASRAEAYNYISQLKDLLPKDPKRGTFGKLLEIKRREATESKPVDDDLPF